MRLPHEPEYTDEELRATDWTEVCLENGQMVLRSGKTGRKIKKPRPSNDVQIQKWRRDEFVAKVIPAAQEFEAEKGIAILGRVLDLSIGHEPALREEAALRDEFLDRLWKLYPGDAYPKKCLLPAQLRARGHVH